ncbi:MAG: hypothetical protein J7L50_02795 [Candidatus Odinarchaeota archaeon]|nr:hypothetical protein [Candidatus Odinarchaeota archaeon]
MVTNLGDSKEYWKGVYDALKLVENFLYYREAHPERSKDIMEFLRDCIREASKKYGPTLLENLGVSFEKEEKVKGAMEKGMESIEEELKEIDTEIIEPQLNIEEELNTEEGLNVEESAEVEELSSKLFEELSEQGEGLESYEEVVEEKKEGQSEGLSHVEETKKGGSKEKSEEKMGEE